jgi:mannose/fructose-specific phosphotransferase system component IIA
MDEVPSLEDMDITQLRAFASTIEAKFHANAGMPKLIEAIKRRQDEMLAEQEANQAAQAKLERIQELEAKGELTPEEQAELQGLKA